jgi:hypothetical protein
MQGSPLVRWLKDRPLRTAGVNLILRLRGERFSVISEMERRTDSALFKWPPLPAHLRLIHVLGFPLRHHVTHQWAGRGYERIAPLGPNDGGGILLGDVPSWPGVVYPVWGADHYLKPRWDIAPIIRNVLLASIDPNG